MNAVRASITNITSRLNDSLSALFNGAVLSLVESTPQLELTCEAVGSPPPDIVWLRNGIVLQNITNRRTITGQFGVMGSVTQSILRLTEVQLSDAGEYTCRATSGNVSPIPGTTAWTFMFAVTSELCISYTTALRCIWILGARCPRARSARGRVRLKSIYTEAPWYK